MPQTHSTATIAQALSGIDFPAKKSDLVEHAKRNNADSEVIDALKENAGRSVHEYGRRLQGRGAVPLIGSGGAPWAGSASVRWRIRRLPV